VRYDEAQQEAARLNREDPRARRLEFYAFDESAGMSGDAWEITMRLRRQGAAAEAQTAPVAPEPPAQPEVGDLRPAAPAALDPAPAAPAAMPAPPEPPAVPAPDVPRRRRRSEPGRLPPAEPESAHAATATQPFDQLEATQPHAAVSTPPPDAPVEPWPAADETAVEQEPDWTEHGEDPGATPRPGRFVRVVGWAVILVAVLWIAMITALAILLRADSGTAILIYIGCAIAGVLGIGVGILIRRG